MYFYKHSFNRWIIVIGLFIYFIKNTKIHRKYKNGSENNVHYYKKFTRQQKCKIYFR